MNPEKIEPQPEAQCKAEEPEAISEELKKELEDARIGVGDIYDHHKNSRDTIEAMLPNLKTFFDNMSYREKEWQEVENSLRACENITEKEEFIEKVIAIGTPVLKFKIDNPKKYEAVQRENRMRAAGNKRLSEVLHYNEEDGAVSVHLATAKTLGIAEVKKSVMEGLEKLASIIKDDEKIEKVILTSWILAKNPELVEKLMGFKDVRMINDEELKERSITSDLPVGEAVMSREDFLKRYLKE